MDASPFVAWGSTGRFGLDGILPQPMSRSWCATCFPLTRHGRVYVVGSFDSFLIVFHALRPLCVLFVDVMTSFSISCCCCSHLKGSDIRF